MDFEKFLKIIETPIPPHIEDAGPKISKSLTITLAKYVDKTT